MTALRGQGAQSTTVRNAATAPQKCAAHRPALHVGIAIAHDGIATGTFVGQPPAYHALHAGSVIAFSDCR